MGSPRTQVQQKSRPHSNMLTMQILPKQHPRTWRLQIHRQAQNRTPQQHLPTPPPTTTTIEWRSMARYRSKHGKHTGHKLLQTHNRSKRHDPIPPPPNTTLRPGGPTRRQTYGQGDTPYHTRLHSAGTTQTETPHDGPGLGCRIHIRA